MKREKLPAVHISPDAIRLYKKKRKKNKELEKRQKAELCARKQ